MASTDVKPGRRPEAAGLRLVILAAGCAAALAGCATTAEKPSAGGPAPAVAAADPMASFTWAGAPGTNTLNGLVAYHPQKGQRWSCSEQSVALMPEAPASRDRVQTLYGSTNFAIRPVSEVREKSSSAGAVPYANYIKQATCDADGKFVFDHVPDGNWFIIARAKKVQPRAKDEEGVAIVQRITLSGGKPVDIKIPAF